MPAHLAKNWPAQVTNFAQGGLALTKPEKGQDNADNDDQSNKIDYPVHCSLLQFVPGENAILTPPVPSNRRRRPGTPNLSRRSANLD